MQLDLSSPLVILLLSEALGLSAGASTTVLNGKVKKTAIQNSVSSVSAKAYKWMWGDAGIPEEYISYSYLYCGRGRRPRPTFSGSDSSESHNIVRVSLYKGQDGQKLGGIGIQYAGGEPEILYGSGSEKCEAESCHRKILPAGVYVSGVHAACDYKTRSIGYLRFSFSDKTSLFIGEESLLPGTPKSKNFWPSGLESQTVSGLIDLHGIFKPGRGFVGLGARFSEIDHGEEDGDEDDDEIEPTPLKVKHGIEYSIKGPPMAAQKDRDA